MNAVSICRKCNISTVVDQKASCSSACEVDGIVGQVEQQTRRQVLFAQLNQGNFFFNRELYYVDNFTAFLRKIRGRGFAFCDQTDDRLIDRKSHFSPSGAPL